MSIEIKRRSLLAAGAATAALAAGGCSSKSGSANNKAGQISDQVTMPTYKALEGLKPDLPGNADGLHDVYLKAPESLLQTTKAKPITSGQITALTETFETPPPPMKDNPFWQRLNQALGGTFAMTVVIDSYPEKFAAILASGDLLDLMWVPPNQGIPNIGPMLESQFTDLTKYLSGDAVLEYPNLAALKPSSWRTAVVNGKIWGAPIPSTPFGQVYLGNPEVWKSVGGFQCSSAQEFLDKCKEISVPGKRWALEPFLPNALHMFGEWFGVPNGYRVNPDRSLTSYLQTDEFAEALEFGVKAFKAGAFYPDLNLAETATLYANGSLGAYVAVGPRSATEQAIRKPGLLSEIMIPFPAVEGRTPTYDMGYGTVGFTPFKKISDEKRIRELLDLINWLSAPFGTVEFMQSNWGTEGKDYVIKDGNYALTGDGQKNVPGLRSALNIMTAGEGVIYNTRPEDSKYIYEQEKKLLQYAMQGPTKGLTSPTSQKVGGKIGTALNDVVNDVMQGRKTMDDFKKALKEWEDKGGKKILEEYASVLPDDVPVTKDPTSK